MTTTGDIPKAPNLMFSHMGLSVRNMPRMERFYTTVLGFTVTDRGLAGGMDLVFLSRDPLDHHQIVLASGRPAELPPNTANPQFGPSINQISFKMGSIADLREMHGRLLAAEGESLFPVNHGIAWSIYAHDPEGNNLEFFIDTDWYITQPFLIPLNFENTDEEIYALTKSLCETSEGYEPYCEWRNRIARRMTPFVTRPRDFSVSTAMWVRSAFWVGQAKPGAEDAFQSAIDDELTPGLRRLPGVRDVKTLWPERLEDQPPRIACQILVTFDGVEDVDRMLASPERHTMRARVVEIAGLFDGKISHIDYRVG